MICTPGTQTHQPGTHLPAQLYNPNPNPIQKGGFELYTINSLTDRLSRLDSLLAVALAMRTSPG